MTAADSVSVSDGALSERVRLRTMRRRRRRVWRRIVSLVVVAVLMLIALLVNRDWVLSRGISSEASAVTRALQETYERESDLPLLVADRTQPLDSLRERYHFNMWYGNEVRWRPRVGVYCSRKPVHFYLRTDARVVVLFDGDRFSWQWLPESEFQTQAAGLGFAGLLEK
jgi:hypothetical protein